MHLAELVAVAPQTDEVSALASNREACLIHCR